jgi:hypothetical protein
LGSRRRCVRPSISHASSARRCSDELSSDRRTRTARRWLGVDLAPFTRRAVRSWAAAVPLSQPPQKDRPECRPYNRGSARGQWPAGRRARTGRWRASCTPAGPGRLSKSGRHTCLREGWDAWPAILPPTTLAHLTTSRAGSGRPHEGRIGGQIRLSQFVFAFSRSAVDERDLHRLGLSAHPPAHAPSHTHQVRIIQVGVRTSKRAPPSAKATRQVRQSKVTVEHAAIHTIVGAGQKFDLISAKLVHHLARSGLDWAAAPGAYKKMLSLATAPQGATPAETEPGRRLYS